jgi:tetratricopeptide (TPR) repeat protein
MWFVGVILQIIRSFPGFRPLRAGGILIALALLGQCLPAETKQFVAFSLRVAEARVKSALNRGEDFRKDDPELYNLGGITRPWAVVIINDQNGQDYILVGEREPKTWTITLDDMAVALRSRYNFPEEDPGVTIDPKHLREDLKQHRRPDFRDDQPQDVRFFGGIGNTHFGRICFDADWLLKNLSFGRSTLPHLQIKSDFALTSEQWRTGERNLTDLRNWFFPSVNRVNVFPDLVLLEHFQLAVLTEVLYAEKDGKVIEDLKNYVDKPSDEFAHSLNDHFDSLVQDSDTVDALSGLARLAALDKGLTSIVPSSQLQFFLASYPLIGVSTPNDAPTLVVDNPDVGLRMSGGVDLRALTRRLKAGDEKALNDIVLAARRNTTNGALTWNFVLDVDQGQLVSVRLPPESQDDLWKAQFALVQGDLLREKGQVEAAIPWYTDFIEHNPIAAVGYVARGVAFSAKGDHDAAVRDFEDAISLDPSSPVALLDRGLEYSRDKNKPSLAVRDFDAAIKIDNDFYLAYCARAEAFQRMGQYDKANADIRTAMALSSEGREAYALRGIDYMVRLKDYLRASEDFNRVIQHGAAPDDIYVKQALCHGMLHKDDEAIDDFNHAIALDSTTDISYLLKALSHKRRVEDYTRYTSVDSRATVVTDGVAGPLIEGAGTRIFSPDGSRVAYSAQIDETKCAVVVDGRPGPEFDVVGARCEISDTAFSEDGTRLAYVGRRAGKWYTVVDGQLGEAYDVAGMPVFSPNGKRVAFAAAVSGRWFVVVDGQAHPSFDGVAPGSFRFSPDGGRWGFVAKDGQKWVVVIDGRRMGSYSGINQSGLHFSNDGKHVAFVASEGRTFVVLDGQPRAEQDAVFGDTLTFNSTGKRLAYVAQRDSILIVCVDGLADMEFASVGHKILFSEDGEHVAFVAIDSNGRMSLVVDGRKGPDFDIVKEDTISVSNDGKRIAYIASTGTGEFVVCNGIPGPRFDKIVPSTLMFQRNGTIEYLAMAQNRISRQSLQTN